MIIYSNWCFDKGYEKTKGEYENICKNDFLSIVATETKRKNRIITLEQLKQFYNETFINVSDKVIMLGTYYGFSLEELVLMKDEDITKDTEYIKVASGKSKRVDKDLLELLIKTKESKEYFRYYAAVGDLVGYKYLDSPYIIKFPDIITKSPKQDVDEIIAKLRLRLFRSKDKNKYPDYTLNVIFYSGLCSSLKALLEETGKKSINDLLKTEEYKRIILQYDKEDLFNSRIVRLYGEYVGD